MAEVMQMEAPAEGEVQEWEEGMEAGGPLPVQTLEVRRRDVPDRNPAPRATGAAPHSRHPITISQIRARLFLTHRLTRLPPSPAQEHGVAASDIKKLVEAGVHTVEVLAHASKKALKDIKGLSEMKVEKLKAAGASRATPNLGTPGLTL